MSEFVYEQESISTNERRMVPLIQKDGDMIRTSEEGLRFLRSLTRTQVSVVGLWSRKKSGRKSLLYSLGIDSDIKIKKHEHHDDNITLVWIWNGIINEGSFQGQERDIIMIQIDDFSNKSIDKNCIERVLSMTILICSHFLYNSGDDKNEEFIQDFGYLKNVSNHFSVNINEESSIEQYSNHLPRFSWVVRGSSKKQTNFETHISSIIDSSHSEHSNSISSFNKLFTSKECIHLSKAKHHGSGDSKGYYELDESFTNFKSDFFSKLDIKTFHGKRLTGSLLIEMIEILKDNYNNQTNSTITEISYKINITETLEMIWTRCKKDIERLYNNDSCEDITEATVYELIARSDEYIKHKHEFEDQNDEFSALLKKKISREIQEINSACQIVSIQKFKNSLINNYSTIEESVKFSSIESFNMHASHFENFIRTCDIKDSPWKSKIFLEFCIGKFSVMIKHLLKFSVENNEKYDNVQNKNTSELIIQIDLYRQKIQELTGIINTIETMKTENVQYMKTLIENITLVLENEKSYRSRSLVEKTCVSCQYLKKRVSELMEKNTKTKNRYDGKVTKLINSQKIEINTLIANATTECQKIKLEFEKWFELKQTKYKETIEKNEIRIQELVKSESTLKLELSIIREEYANLKIIHETETTNISSKTESLSQSIETLLAELYQLRELIKQSDNDCERSKNKIKEMKEIEEEQKREIFEKQNEIISLTIMNQGNIQKYNLERAKIEQYETKERQWRAEIENIKYEQKLLNIKTTTKFTEYENIIKTKIEEIKTWEVKYNDYVAYTEKEKLDIINDHNTTIANLNKSYSIKITKLKTELEEISEESENYDGMIEALKEKIKKVQESSKNEINQLNERISKFSEKENGYFNQIEELNNKIEKYQSNERKLLKDVTKLTEDIEAEQERVSTIRSTIEELTRTISIKEEEYRKITEKYNEVLLEKKKLKITYDGEIEILEAEKLRLEGLVQNSRFSSTENIRITQLENEKSEIETKLVHLNEKYSRLESQIENYEQAEKQHINQISELKSRLFGMSEENDRWKSEIARLKEKIELKDEEFEELSRKSVSHQSTSRKSTHKKANIIEEVSYEIKGETSKFMSKGSSEFSSQ